MDPTTAACLPELTTVLIVVGGVLLAGLAGEWNKRRQPARPSAPAESPRLAA